MVDRRCVSCWQVKNRDELIKITAKNDDGKVIVNPNSTTFGRSVYLCYNDSCIEGAFKKGRISKILRASTPEDLKGKLLNEF